MVLEVETDTRKVNQGLDAGLAELLWVTNTRSLKDERRAHRTARNNDLLASTDGPGLDLSGVDRLGRDDLDANSPVALKNNL